jgi:hypothetical protein
MNKDVLGIIGLVSEIPEGHTALARSERFPEYLYAAAVIDVPALHSMFGNLEESEAAFAETPECWLAALADCKSFSDFEAGVVSTFGGEQAAIRSMAPIQELERTEINVAVSELDSLRTFGDNAARKRLVQHILGLVTQPDSPGILWDVLYGAVIDGLQAYVRMSYADATAFINAAIQSV